MATIGGSGDAGQNTAKDDLEILWKYIYDKIEAKYNATDPWSIKILQKNFDTHLGQGKSDGSKSVVAPHFDPHLLCHYTFFNFSKSCVKISNSYNNIKTTRLCITGKYNTSIGWANYDSAINSEENRDEDSSYFQTIYQREWGKGPFIVLSVQVSKTLFLTNNKSTSDTYIVEG